IHPIKLMDGFWTKITDATTGKEEYLADAEEFINYPYGNRFRYRAVLNGIQVERFQFCPDGRPGVIVQFTIRNTSGKAEDLRFQFSGKTELTPVWYSKEIGIEDSNDSIAWDSDGGFFVGHDDSHPWFVIWGSDLVSSAQSTGNEALQQNTIGKGIGASEILQLSLKPTGSAVVTFVIAGSNKSKEDAIQTYRDTQKEQGRLLESKKKRYALLLSRSRIKIPDARLQEVYDWVKIDTDWLVREVPGIGRGLGGGLMEYPWWFGTDSSYSMQAV